MQEFADDDNVGGQLELPFSTADEDKEMYDATSDWDALNGSLHEPLHPGLHDEYSVPMMHDEPATELHSTLPHSVHGQVNAQPYAKREPKPVEPRAEQGTARTRAKEEQRLARESGRGLTHVGPCGRLLDADDDDSTVLRSCMEVRCPILCSAARFCRASSMCAAACGTDTQELVDVSF